MTTSLWDQFCNKACNFLCIYLNMIMSGDTGRGWGVEMCSWSSCAAGSCHARREGGGLLAWPTTAASPQITMEFHISDWTHKFQDKTGLDAKANSELYISKRVCSAAGMLLTRKSLVNDIPAGDGKTAYLFYSVGVEFMVTWVLAGSGIRRPGHEVHQGNRSCTTEKLKSYVRCTSKLNVICGRWD